MAENAENSAVLAELKKTCNLQMAGNLQHFKTLLFTKTDLAELKKKITVHF
jgi:hypothetical protein